MASIKENPTTEAHSRLQILLQLHLKTLAMKGYSEFTIRNRLVHIRLFLRWCADHGISTPSKITRAILTRYQQHLCDHRTKDGQPLAVASRHARLVPLRVWFRWMARERHIRRDLADAIELPRLGRALPRNIFSVKEVERVLTQPDLRSRIGLRDRTIMEVLYSTGIRRLELVRLKVEDLQLDRGLIFVKEGKGKKDRYVPVGTRAIEWLHKYIRRARPKLAGRSETRVLFLSLQGQSISRDHLTWIARKYIKRANLDKGGACHLFRHTMATLMHDNGADIYSIQQMLGHADIRTTQIYTQVAIRKLQQVHAATHPAAA